MMGEERPGVHSVFSVQFKSAFKSAFNPTVFSGVEFRALWRELFHTNLGKPWLHGQCLCTGALSGWNRFEPFNSITTTFPQLLCNSFGRTHVLFWPYIAHPVQKCDQSVSDDIDNSII